MAVKLLDLQLIYGVAGAREKFEDLVSQLVAGEQPDADKVRIQHGDGGIDVHVGELTDPAGIDIYQCKFFPQGLEEAQKQQIRKSFRVCKDSGKFKTKSWTLCLPIDLSVDEKRWFEEWRSKQDDSGITIQDPWGARKLEGLLYQDKNKGLKESFFKEEHLAQIRELHGMMQSLLAEIGERLRKDETSRQQALQADALALQASYIDQFIQSTRDRYKALTKPPPVSYSEMQQAVKGRDDRRVKAIQSAGKRPAHWEVVIRPSWLPAQPQIRTLKECLSIIDACRVGSDGWKYPDYGRGTTETGTDWVGAFRVYDREAESWRLSQRGLFVHMFSLWDDVQSFEIEPEWVSYTVPQGFVAKGYFDIDVAIRTFTHIFRFAAQLATRAFDPGEGAADIRILLSDTRNRALITTQDLRRLRACYYATEPALENTWHCKREELSNGADILAIKATLWFFERFGWHDASGDVLARIQARIFSGR